MDVHERLATYGTLSPGRSNHGQLAGLKGRWLKGVVKGHVARIVRGPARGYPGLTLDDHGPKVAVHLFESTDLPSHWARLDAFEGEGYRRVAVRVRTATGVLAAFIYVVA